MGLLDRLRTNRLDVALAVAFTVLGLAQLPFVPIAAPGVGVLYVLGSTLPLAWRRAFPIEAALVASAFWFIPLEGFPLFGLVVAVLQLFPVGHRGRPGLAVVAVTAWAALAGVVGTLLGPEEPVAALTSLMVVVTPVVVGWLLRREQRRTQALVELTRELAEERRRAEEAAVGAERVRIAQELHDVVGHEVTLMAIQAEAATAALRVDPERAVAPVEAIRATAHRTLAEIRSVLGLLAPADTGTHPSVEEVEAIVARARQAGVPCRLSVTGAPGPEQTSASLAVGRIVRECLTNAARHAPGAEVCVEVCWTPDGVRIRATNATDARRPAGAGRGLTGMRHRAELLGGTFAAGADGEHFEVSVAIPAAVR